MMRAVPLVGMLLACSGPPASDAALCRDVARRICISECGNAFNSLGLQLVTDCEGELQRRTRCDTDDFVFADHGVDRSAFLSCRLPILRAGDHVDQRPDCMDVDDMFRGCPTMQQFYLRDGGI